MIIVWWILGLCGLVSVGAGFWLLRQAALQSPSDNMDKWGYAALALGFILLLIALF